MSTPLAGSARLSRFCAGIAVSMGGLVLAGWALGLPLLKSVVPQLAACKPNTALAMILAGGALLALCPGPGVRPRTRLATALACGLSGLAFLTLCEHWTGTDLHLDALLFQVPVTAQHPYPLRMTTATAYAFLALGLGLLALAAAAVRTSQLAALAASLPALLALITDLYDLRALATFTDFGAMTLPTALSQATLAAGVAAARPEAGWGPILLQAGPGRQILLRFLPLALLLPVLGGSAYLRTAGGRQPPGGPGLFLLAAMVALALAACVLGLAVSLHRADRAGEEAARALRQSEAHFRTLTEALPDLLILLQPGGALEYLSPSLLRYVGEISLDPEQPLAGLPWHSGDLDRIVRELRKAVLKREAIVTEARLGRNDGACRRHQVEGLAIRDAEGELQRYLVQLLDVEDQRQVEAEIARHALAVERARLDLEDFVASVSADLQRPLAEVAGAAEQLAALDDGTMEAEAQEFVTFLREGALRMQALVQGLLAYSRVDSRGAPPELVDVHRVLKVVLADLSAAITGSDARITAAPLPHVLADPLQLGQLLRNLIGNAIKYHRPGVVPEIRLSAQADGEGWRFAVADNGIGIEPRHFERIFEIFQRLHGRSELAGTGIGLAICKRVVERHGGRIWVESVPGSGSTFCFTLPGPPSAAPSSS